MRISQTRIGKPLHYLTSGIEMDYFRLEQPPCHGIVFRDSLQTSQTEKNQEHKRTSHQNGNGNWIANQLPVTAANLGQIGFAMAPHFRDTTHNGHRKD